MELYSNPDAEINETLDKRNSLYDRLASIPRKLIGPSSHWTYDSFVTFCMCISQIDFSADDWYRITFDNIEFCEARNIKTDANHRRERVKAIVNNLYKNCEFHWEDPKDKERYERGVLITNIRSREKGKTTVVLNQEFKDLFVDMKSYIPYFVNDLYKLHGMEGKMYLELRNHWDDRYMTNTRFYTVNELKEILGISENAYMHQVRGKQRLNRTLFEKKINALLTAISKNCKSILIYPKKTKVKENNKELVFFEKKYSNGSKYIEGYEITYKCFTRTKPEGLID